MSKRKNKSGVAVAILSEPIEKVVTPWLLVVMLMITAFFVILQYVSV